MIPPFDENGYLPPGIHPATLDEIEARFGVESELRRVQMESLRWLADLAWRLAAVRIVINGSFVTDAYEPNDVDCALLFDPHTLEEDDEAELRQGLPFLELNVMEQADFDWLVGRFFAYNREFEPKGMIEVIR